MARHMRTVEVTGVKFVGIGYQEERLYEVTYTITWWVPNKGPTDTMVIGSSARYVATDELDAYNKCMREKE